MFKHLYKISGLVGFALLAIGSGTTAPAGMFMSDVMRLCDQGQSYQSYTVCIRQTYDAKGNGRNLGSVHAFYAGMDAIREANGKGAMTDIQAKAATYDVWLRTIDASNRANAASARANAPTVCRNYNGTMICF